MYLKKQNTMNNEEKYIAYLVDLIPIIQEKRLEQMNQNTTDRYETGQLQAYSSLLDYMKKLAQDNELPVQVLGLDVLMRNRINDKDLQNQNDLKYKKIISQIVAYCMQQVIKTKQKKDLLSQGQLLAYYDILTIMKEQAELAFDININELGIKDTNLEELAFA